MECAHAGGDPPGAEAAGEDANGDADGDAGALDDG